MKAFKIKSQWHLANYVVSHQGNEFKIRGKQVRLL